MATKKIIETKKVETKKTTETKVEVKQESKLFRFKRTYIGTYGLFIKGKSYLLNPDLQKIFMEEIEEC